MIHHNKPQTNTQMVQKVPVSFQFGLLPLSQDVPMLYDRWMKNIQKMQSIRQCTLMISLSAFFNLLRIPLIFRLLIGSQPSGTVAAKHCRDPLSKNLKESGALKPQPNHADSKMIRPFRETHE